MYIDIPTYNSATNTWTTTEFGTKEEFITYVEGQVKEPGFYHLKDTDRIWRKTGNAFRNNRQYCPYLDGTRDSIKFWDFEKKKCRLVGGVIFDGRFVPGVMYFYINFLQINDKVKGKMDFPDIWDSDLHFFLHILLCKLQGKHSVVVKKRQAGYTFKHIAIVLNNIWFGSAQVNKIIAYDKSFVEGAWNFLEDYRNFLNTHTAWKRNFTPDKRLDWQQKIEFKDLRGRKTYRGNMSVIKGLTTEKSPSKGVGGKNDLVYMEEAGINPTLGDTLEYLLPAVKAGNTVTGLIMVSGSVGELDDCQPLKELIHDPVTYGFRGVENIWEPDSPTRIVGFFVPEHWSYEGCIDEHGNSDIEAALKEIQRDKEAAKKRSPEKYRLFCSQHPSTLKEAFDWRKDSVFPIGIILDQINRIQISNDYGLNVDLDRDENGNIRHRILDRGSPVREFPAKPSTRKEGCVVMWEPPDPGAKFGTYYGAVDPVISGKTTTSDSLFSIYIYKNIVESKKIVDGVVQTELTGDRIVACWTGRFDDVNKTNERAEMLVEYYNAFTVVENNVDSFIKHMIKKKKQKFLARKDDLPFIKELNANRSSFQEFGVRMTETIKTHILNTVIEYLKEEIGAKHNNEGKEIGTVLGVERIPDDMLLLEMQQYHPDLNTDRLIAFGMVLALAKSRQANGLITRREEVSMAPRKVDYSKSNNPFRHLGGSGFDDNRQTRSGFRHIT